MLAERAKWDQCLGSKVPIHNTHLRSRSSPAPSFIRLYRGRRRFRSRNLFSISCIRWAGITHVWRGLFVSLLILRRVVASTASQITKQRTYPRSIIIIRASDPGGVRIPVSTVVVFSGLNRVGLGLGVNGIPLILAIMIGA